jgi:hypothetical protein
MEWARLSCILAAVCGLLCSLLSSCDRSGGSMSQAETIQHTNKILQSCELPVLPDGVTDVHCWTGGVFAKYMGMRFNASADQALDYLRKAGAAGYIEFQAQGDTHQIVATHSLTSGSVTAGKPDHSWLAGGDGISQPWFKRIDEIRHGWCYYYSEDWPARYYIYYDLDDGYLYVCWYYS